LQRGKAVWVAFECSLSGFARLVELAFTAFSLGFSQVGRDEPGGGLLGR
jgi:hypothetical protein